MAVAGMNKLEKYIADRAHAFDPISLLHLLRFMGYRSEEIFFKGHIGLASQPCLIQAIDFQQEPVRRVTLSLHLGLLAPQSPLPTYFLHKLDKGTLDANAFADFIGFFDHPILQQFILSSYPELNRDFFPDWEKAKRDRLLMLDLRSCSTLHWVCRLVFPELEVRVEKAVLSRSLETTQIILGEAVLGSDSVFGKHAAVPVYGKRITFFADEERTAHREPWPKAIRRRFEISILPLLQSMGLSMEIFLVIRGQSSWAKLHGESYLGYDMLRSVQARTRRVLIFSGEVR
jgi:hypothetical protein